MATLMVTESADLERCESVIEKGMGTFVEVGQALARIRDGRLYRDEYKSFAVYVKQRWGKTRDWADMTITSSQVVARLEVAEHVPQKPNARQAEALAKAPKETQAEVWADVVEEHGEKVTAAKVAEVVEKRKEAAKPTPKTGEAPRNKNGSERITAASRKAALAALGGLVRSLDQMGIVDRCRSMLASIESEIQDAV